MTGPLRDARKQTVTGPLMAKLFTSGAHEVELSDAQAEQLWQRLNAPGAAPIVAPHAGPAWFEAMASQAPFADAGSPSETGHRSFPRWPKQRWVAGLLLAALFAGGGVFAGTGFFKFAPVVDAANPVSLAPTLETRSRQRAGLPPQPSAASDSAGANPEAALLLEALKRLRRDNDAAGALSLLNSHAAGFPSGAMKREVTLARIEALMVLKERAQALALLKAEDLDLLPKGAELRVLRGELSGALGHCRGALVDFEPTLNSPASDALKSRALFGRASCSSRLGQHAAAQRDFKDYLETYPTGSFAAEAKRALRER